MKRYWVIVLLLAGAVLGLRAVEDSKPGFLPLTPDGYPAGPSNAPAAIPAAAPTSEPAVRGIVSTNANSESGSELDDRHKLAAGDKVSFTILEDRFFPSLTDNRTAPPATAADLSKALIVADTGELDVPYVGRVMVAGRTCKDVAAEVKVLLEKDYYYKATVVLGLDQMSRTQGRVYISGEVRSPGPVLIPPNENFTVGKAILGAGGFTEWAKKTKVQVVRAAKPGQPASEPITVDMEQVLEKGRADKDVPLNPEDYIIVPRSFIRM